MNVRSRQAGATLLGTLVGLAVLVAIVAVGLKVGPHYLDFWALRKVMDNVNAAAAEKVDSPEAFFAQVQRGVQVNNIRDLDLSRALSVDEQGRLITGRLNYEKREHLVANIDLVLVFKHESSVTAP